MSWHGKAILRLDVPPHVKYLLLVLDQYANRDGWCKPSLARLAAEMGQTQRTVQRSRDLAVDLGLLAYKPGKWKGHSGEYVLPKGDANVALTDARRVTLERAKGWRYRPPKGDAHVHRSSKNFHEADAGTAPRGARPARLGGDSAMSPTLTVVPIATQTDQGKRNERRALAQAIRNAKVDSIRKRFLANFEKRYPMYPASSRKHNVRPIHPSVLTIVRTDEVA